MGDGLSDLRYTERLERPALVRFPADGRTDLLYAQSTHLFLRYIPPRRVSVFGVKTAVYIYIAVCVSR